MGLIKLSELCSERIQNNIFEQVERYFDTDKKQFKIGDKVEVISDNRSKGLQGIITRVIGDQYQIDGNRVFVAKSLKMIDALCSDENKEDANMSETKKPITMGILDMWYQKMSKQINDETEIEKEKLTNEDPVKCSFDEKAKELEMWAQTSLGDKYLGMVTFGILCNFKTFDELMHEECWSDVYLSDNTKALIDVVNQKKICKRDALHEKKVEIETMLYSCTNPDDEWAVLNGYGVVNDDMTLNVDGNAKECHCKKEE